jgi:uncharacterized membrane protein
MEDSTTQNALGTFIGSFLFAVVGIIALSTGSYGNTGRVVLFIVTLGVIGLIIFTLLRWIDHLSRLGRVGETTDRVEKAAFTAIADRVENPYLGGVPLLDVTRQIPANVSQICVEKIGYIQHIDMSALSALAKKLERQIYVAALPGTFVYRNRPLAWMATPGDDRSHDDIRRAFTIEDERSFDQDPRFGMIVLAEIASRALSPAVNDPGTAIDVIGRSVRLLSLWCDRSTAKSDGEIRFHNVHVPPVLIDEMFDDIYTAIAHDGASIVAVHTRLQKAFLALAQMGDERFKQSARRHSQLALKRASAALALDEDKELLNKLASDIDSM